MDRKEVTDVAIARVPLLFFPVILYSVVGLTYAFKTFATVVPTGLWFSWFFTPQHSGAVAYTLFGVMVSAVIWLWASRGGFKEQIVPLARLSWRYVGWASIALVAAYCWPPQALRFVISLGLRGRNYNILDPETFALIAVYAVLIGPACEEILFRGFGMGYLIARGVNRWLAGGIIMVLFVLMHWLPFGPGGVLLVLPFTVLVTVLRIVSGNLTPGILFHMMNNIVAFLVLPILWVTGHG